MVKSGIKDVRALKSEMRAVIKATSPTAKIDYIAFTEFDSLKPVSKASKSTICSLAVWVYNVRLIDNMRF